MVQNHILQLLCLVAMEPPTSLGADAVRDEKLKVLKSLKPVDEVNVDLLTVRGQYKAAPPPAAPSRAISKSSASRRPTPRPSSPSRPRSTIGAGPACRSTCAPASDWRAASPEIVVAFRHIPHSVFDGGAGPISNNRLVIRLQPDEGVRLWLMIKDPGPGGMRLQYVPLDMSFAEAFGVRNPDAYERLIMDVVRGNQTLFMRRDEVEAAWTWIDPILEAWKSRREPPKPYVSGTWGPSAAVALIERDGRTWHEDDA